MHQVIFAVLIGFVAALGCGHFLIPVLQKLKAGQSIREDGPQSHLKKAGTPTMGGIFITLGVLVAAAFFLAETGNYLWFAVIGATAFGLIGFIDDLIKVLKHRSLGLRPYQKIVAQVVFAALVAVYAYKNPAIGSKLYVPILDVYWDLGLWYIPFTMFAIIAMTNSVNLTDGLDGLAGSVTLANAAAFTLIFLPLLDQTVWGEDMAIFAAALTGAILGFLRYNAFPAKVFMGDVGSFFLGGALTMMGIASRLQLLLPIMGIMYVVSSVSCILQVGSYKLRGGKRIFKMAPLHHHFELSGVHETKIVCVYAIITVVFCLLTLLMVS